MDRTALAIDLRSALENGEISAWFQPQEDLESGKIVGAEALCRWNHPEFGYVSPALFIPIAEEEDLIQEIGQFMVEESCAAAAAWSELADPIEVSVNVSAVQLRTSDFTDRLAEALGELNLVPRALTIEITESLPIDDGPAVSLRLDELKELGLGISVDDFGAGHSSIQQLKQIRATELKIDQSLIRDPSLDTLALLTAVVELVHDAGVRVVAEGVETQAQLDRVRELGCDRVQGYLTGRPMPKAQFEQLLVD